MIHNAGGSEAQELGFALASALSYLRTLEARGFALDDARRSQGEQLSAAMPDDGVGSQPQTEQELIDRPLGRENEVDGDSRRPERGVLVGPASEKMFAASSTESPRRGSVRSPGWRVTFFVANNFGS